MSYQEDGIPRKDPIHGIGIPFTPELAKKDIAGDIVGCLWHPKATISINRTHAAEIIVCFPIEGSGENVNAAHTLAIRSLD